MSPRVEAVLVWLSVAEAARRLRLPRQQVCGLVRSGVIPGVKCGPARNSPWRVTERAVAGYQRESRA